MITNKLKINDSKTELIVFRSPKLKCDLSGLLVNVGESKITQLSKVRDLGIIFNPFLNFDDQITAICKSTHFHIRNIGKKLHNNMDADCKQQCFYGLYYCYFCFDHLIMVNAFGYIVH